MKALKIIGIVVGGLAVLGAVVLVAVGVLMHSVIGIETEQLKKEDYLGPYAGTVLARASVPYSSHGYTVRYVDAQARTVTTTALGLGSPYPKPGDQVSVFVRADDHSDVQVTAHPGLERLSGRLQLAGYVTGGVGVVLIVGCSVLLATGRRKRLAAGGQGGPGGPPRPGPSQQPASAYLRPPHSPQQASYPPQPSYPQQQPSPQQSYPPQQYPPRQGDPRQQYPPRQGDPRQQYPAQPPYPQPYQQQPYQQQPSPQPYPQSYPQQPNPPGPESTGEGQPRP